jgi:hypothetical protein
MKILIIGNEGSTGKRYEKIIRSLGHQITGYDIKELGHTIPNCDRAIIASPTLTHIHYARYCQERRIHYLVEKPACSSVYDVDEMTGCMVNNWCFVFDHITLLPGSHKIFYRNNYTGTEGYWFDTCQLHILSDRTGSIIKRRGGFDTTIDGRVVTLKDIEDSYVRMIKSWLNDDGRVWRVSDIADKLKWVLSQTGGVL